MTIKDFNLRKVLACILLFTSATVNAQRIIAPTDTLRVSGKIKHDFSFSLNALDTFATKDIGDVVITNQHGEVKRIAKGLKGIPLKNLFAAIEFDTDKPKELNEFYFNFIASDGYKVVFSWNEIYNTETGNNLYVIIEEEGKKVRNTDNRVLIMATKDFATGRRLIKGTGQIVVSRVE